MKQKIWIYQFHIYVDMKVWMYDKQIIVLTTTYAGPVISIPDVPALILSQAKPINNTQ